MDEKIARELVRQQLRKRTLTAAAASRLSPGHSTDIFKLINLLNSRDPLMRIGAIKNLAAVRGEEAISAIARCLRDPYPQVRLAACRTLGRLRAHIARNRLYDTLNDRDPQVCCAAAGALGQMGDKFGLPCVIKLLKNDDYWPDALRALNTITGQNFAVSASGLKDALNWVKLTRKLSR